MTVALQRMCIERRITTEVALNAATRPQGAPRAAQEHGGGSGARSREEAHMRTLYEPKRHDYDLRQARAAQSAATTESTESTDASLEASHDASHNAMEIRKSERRRLAHDLHDTVVQPLTALLISMETVSQPGDAE